MMKRVTKAVLPVAGFGTRVLPATKTVPKEMLTIVDRPALQYVVDEAIEAGIEHFVFVTARGKSAIVDYFDSAYELEDTLLRKGKKDIYDRLKAKQPVEGTMSFVRQQQARGLGHAVWCARDIIGDEPFAVLLPDVLIQSEQSCLAQMMDVYNQVGGNIIAVDPVPEDKVSSYGVIKPKSGEDFRSEKIIAMDGMVEKPPVAEAPSNLKITGRYILQPELMGLLKDQAAGAGGEIQLTDAMARLMETQDFHAFAYEGQDYDCGSKLGYFEAVMAYARTHADIGEGARALIRQSAELA
ncbi:UTP--glucose-1-phosphate uridylyltransferase [Litorimonas cladophorae]|uniref:UTP--glucose-1-phosphate uridylyltransferase n=2 Tax=Litorimonas cladophorae TaxID=1220491 RepID=A0A918KP03_9PROT|nr:UTP--glucose-1-phosphate uridylyltransferase [Litorimonas cladophorae]